MNAIDKLTKIGLIPVIKIDDPLDAVPLVNALKAGSLPVAEITFRTAAAEEAIKRVNDETEGIMLGAGTVLTVEQAKKAVAAGAAYIVSPGLNPAVVGWCVENGVPVLPGCANPSDIETALSFGLKTVKFFPAEALGGLKLIKAMAAPYGDIGFVPTGGINEKNFLDYIAFDKVKAIGGTWMAPSDAVKAKDWDKITFLAKQAVDTLLGLKVNHIGINAESKEEADRLTDLIKLMMGAESRDIGWMNIVGAGFEVLYGKKRGVHGHFAINTNSMERAMYHLEMRGFKFNEPISPKAVFMKDTLGGFEVELVQR